MKSIKSLIGVALISTAAAGFLTGCQDNFDNPPMIVPEATIQANTTIAELKEAFWKDDTNYATLVPYKDTDTKEEYIIRGRVISSDAAGNVYKSLYLQDETAAITLSINKNSLYNDYRIGQEVVMSVTGLYIGKYAGLEQIGGLGEYNGTPQVSFMVADDFTAKAELNGLPDGEMDYINYGDPLPAEFGNMYTIVTSIAELPNTTAGQRAMMSQLIELRNVHFAEGGSATFAEYQKATSRSLLDEAGNSIDVRTSGYATFYNEILPSGVGTVKGLLSFYNGSWQIVLNSAADCHFDNKGQESDPYTVAEAIELEDTGVAGWVTGYIVGSVKGGVSNITSASDIIWGADAEMDNTIVIGQTADSKQLDQVLVMELPSGSDLRKQVNLIDNPSNIGKEIKVRGTFANFLGTYGITGNKGTQSEFVFGSGNSGDDNPSTTGPKGSGTSADPYNVAKALEVAKANGESSSTDVYTAGYVITASIDTSYGNGTFVIADDKAGTGSTITVFRAKDLGNEKFTSTSKVKVGDYIVVCAPLINYKGNTPETSYGYLYSINGETSSGNTDNPGTGGGDSEAGTPAGSGTETDPFNVAYILASSSDATGVWVEGYVVGSVSGQVWTSGATFSATPGSEYTNTNLILADSQSANSTSVSVPVQLPSSPASIRQTLGLGNNPSIYKAHVMLKGDITKYFGVRGFKNMTEFKVLD